MPSGYTATLYEGKPQTFEQFALEAARGMGAAIMQRDDAPGPIADEYEPSYYYRDAIKKDEARLAELHGFTSEDWIREERKSREKRTAEANDAIERAAACRSRYEKMLAQVAAWVPPTSEHENFKKFMTDQLTESIKFDCSTSYLTVAPPQSWQEYRDVTIATLEKQLERARVQWVEELERTAGRNKWVRDLRESLRGPADV